MIYEEAASNKRREVAAVVVVGGGGVGGGRHSSSNKTRGVGGNLPRERRRFRGGKRKKLVGSCFQMSNGATVKPQ